MDEQPTSDERLIEQTAPGVSLREAQRRLQLGSVQTVQRWLKDGKLGGRRTALPDGREKWEVFLPSDEAELERLRAQLRRPAAPSDVVFPGPPPAVAAEDPRDRLLAFLQEELSARREEVASRDRLISELVARRAQPALPDPSPVQLPKWWWLCPWRYVRR